MVAGRDKHLQHAAGHRRDHATPGALRRAGGRARIAVTQLMRLAVEDDEERIALPQHPRAAGRAVQPEAERVAFPARAFDMRGAVLLVMEAMKVQMRITAPADGTVTALRCAVGELVEDGAELVTIESAPSA